MLLTIMTPVVQVRDVPDPKNKKSPGSGKISIKNSLRFTGHAVNAKMDG